MADVSYAAPSQVFSMPTYWNFQVWCERGLVAFCCVNPDVTIYEDGKTEPEILSGAASETNILEDFILEVQQGTNTFTDSVFAASETALRLQQAAENSKGNQGVLV